MEQQLHQTFSHLCGMTCSCSTSNTDKVWVHPLLVFRPVDTAARRFFKDISHIKWITAGVFLLPINNIDYNNTFIFDLKLFANSGFWNSSSLKMNLIKLYRVGHVAHTTIDGGEGYGVVMLCNCHSNGEIHVNLAHQIKRFLIFFF